MSKLKIVVPLLILVGLAAAAYTYLNQQLSQNQTAEIGDVFADSVTQADGVDWYQDTIKTIFLAVFTKPFEIGFTPESAQSLREQARLKGYVLAVNGTYYRGSYVNAEHAGLLQIAGEQLEPLTLDKQLTHVVVYDIQADMLNFMPAETFAEADYQAEQYTLFQSGPLIIEKNQIQTDLIVSSQNGTSRNLRTLLGYTESGRKFILVTRASFNLEELANEILELSIFKSEVLNVINLDGGASTAMYSRDLDQFNFLNSKRLPVIIGVK